MMKRDIFFSIADEDEFNDIIVGKGPPNGSPWGALLHMSPSRMPHGKIGVLYETISGGPEIRLVSVVVHPEDQRRLFGRVAALHRDVSPLSTWCHIVSPDSFSALDSCCRDADLFGLEASWAGVIIAEATLLSAIPVNTLKLPTCLATSSFAVARCKALWSTNGISEVVERYDAARALFGADELSGARHRQFLTTIWTVLSDLAGRSERYVSHEVRILAECLRSLKEAREAGIPNEAAAFVRPLLSEGLDFHELMEIEKKPPEARLKIFDRTLASMTSRGTYNTAKSAYAMIAGYIATIVAGGEASFTLIDKSTPNRDEILTWAYLIGGLGEKVIWSSSFDGLGRLVARELTRSVYLNEPPASDFAYEEASVIVDPKLKDPYVFLQIKQARNATVSLYCGVNVVFPVYENGNQEATNPRRPQPVNVVSSVPSDPLPQNFLETLASALFPYIESRFLGSERASLLTPTPTEPNKQKKGRGKRSTSNPKPFI